jgi:trehalose-phosphatase
VKLARELALLIEEIAEKPHAMLLLDFDGTLAPFRSRPELAGIDDSMRAILDKLHRGRTRVALISGRGIEDLKRRVGLPHLSYSGVFGQELSEPGWSAVHPHAKAARPALAGMLRELEELFAGLPGIRLEDKRVGLALHYRAVPEERRPDFSRRWEKAKKLAPPGLRWRRGQRDWEVTPTKVWDKGRAALMFWRRHNKPFLLSIGDDLFDEPMFRACRGRGVSIKVGPGPTKANHRVDTPEEVACFLHALAERLAGRDLLEKARKKPELDAGKREAYTPRHAPPPAPRRAGAAAQPRRGRRSGVARRRRG